MQQLYDLFDEEMISVVQGAQAGDDSSMVAEEDVASNTHDTNESTETSNILLRAMMIITSLFQKLF